MRLASGLFPGHLKKARNKIIGHYIIVWFCFTLYFFRKQNWKYVDTDCSECGHDFLEVDSRIPRYIFGAEENKLETVRVTGRHF